SPSCLGDSAVWEKETRCPMSPSYFLTSPGSYSLLGYCSEAVGERNLMTVCASGMCHAYAHDCELLSLSLPLYLLTPFTSDMFCQTI
ncbi:uncharacterized, partial [Tachysurus ichikawai]